MISFAPLLFNGEGAICLDRMLANVASITYLCTQYYIIIPFYVYLDSLQASRLPCLVDVRYEINE